MLINFIPWDPFSKTILGWVFPTLVYDQNYEVTLEPFTTTGDCLFISKLDNGTYFDEFYVISLYTPDGLNEYKHDMEYGLYSISGVLIYHVNSRTKKDITNVTNIQNIYRYLNNEAFRRLIEIVPCGDNDINKTFIIDDSDLYLEGDILNIEDLGLEIIVKSLNESSCEISIVFNK